MEFDMSIMGAGIPFLGSAAGEKEIGCQARYRAQAVGSRFQKSDVSTMVCQVFTFVLSCRVLVAQVDER